MKKKALLAAILSFMALGVAVTGYANDSASAVVEVLGIDPHMNLNSWQDIKISFSGKDLQPLIKVLPAIQSTYGAAYNKHVRELSIASKEYTIRLSCADTGHYGPTNPPACIFSVFSNSEDEDLAGDTFKWEPKNKLTKSITGVRFDKVPGGSRAITFYGKEADKFSGILPAEGFKISGGLNKGESNISLSFSCDKGTLLRPNGAVFKGMVCKADFQLI
ncbi:MAG: hypothetical protein A2270_06465 [Elusimicrobia bacterium RIFOXYA12_FULL_51_18]|nr:MAG: hypothetical protein A2270_06465 [Elusimicrobia bacterium RIFOXYA12_FULL_51_18]OGS29428.1 MAG: hypothetical protein A2218_00285 [Elusimicrobia bacterium RIFOXYA2_FULL_53_38]